MIKYFIYWAHTSHQYNNTNKITLVLQSDYLLKFLQILKPGLILLDNTLFSL